MNLSSLRSNKLLPFSVVPAQDLNLPLPTEEVTIVTQNLQTCHISSMAFFFSRPPGFNDSGFGHLEVFHSNYACSWSDTRDYHPLSLIPTRTSDSVAAVDAYVLPSHSVELRPMLFSMSTSSDTNSDSQGQRFFIKGVSFDQSLALGAIIGVTFFALKQFRLENIVAYVQSIWF